MAKNWRQENEAYMASMATREGFEKWDDGLYCRYLVKAECDPDARTPKKDSVVTCHYTGRLINGRVFDDSRKNSVPVAFRVRELIPGFQNTLREMHVGDKVEACMSWKMGYGKLACGSDIPGYSTLIFEVELISIY